MAIAALAVSLILAATPYLGGADLVLFKTPTLPPGVTRVLQVLGPLLVVVFAATFVPAWPAAPRDQRAVDATSKYYLQSISEIVKAEVAARGIQIQGLDFRQGLGISDVEKLCRNVWAPAKSREEIREILAAARATAFSKKYAEPREDEKLADHTKIPIHGLESWEAYFLRRLAELGASDLNQLDVVYVGIGHGHADRRILSGIHSFRATDISEEALRNARKLYSQMQSYVNPAEKLVDVATSSTDLYLSLRTFQSTLFDRRAALHEAYRVLRPGGLIVLSIPTMFLQNNGTPLLGLLPPGSPNPDMKYAQWVANRFVDDLQVLNFQSVEMDPRSPFEIYISARR